MPLDFAKTGNSFFASCLMTSSSGADDSELLSESESAMLRASRRGWRRHGFAEVGMLKAGGSGTGHVTISGQRSGAVTKPTARPECL